MTEDKKDQVCPICGCDKPKELVDGHYRCKDCNCKKPAKESWPGPGV